MNIGGLKQENAKAIFQRQVSEQGVTDPAQQRQIAKSAGITGIEDDTPLYDSRLYTPLQARLEGAARASKFHETLNPGDTSYTPPVMTSRFGDLFSLNRPAPQGAPPQSAAQQSAGQQGGNISAPPPAPAAAPTPAPTSYAGGDGVPGTASG